MVTYCLTRKIPHYRDNPCLAWRQGKKSVPPANERNFLAPRQQGDFNGLFPHAQNSEICERKFIYMSRDKGEESWVFVVEKEISFLERSVRSVSSFHKTLNILFRIMGDKSNSCEIDT